MQMLSKHRTLYLLNKFTEQFEHQHQYMLNDSVVAV